MMILRKGKAPLLIMLRLREQDDLDLLHIEWCTRGRFRLAYVVFALLWWKLVIHM
jgi:hypothetical protein